MNKEHPSRKILRVKKRKYAIDKLGGQCNLCHVSALWNEMEFDHIDRATKEFDISRGIYQYSLSRIDQELSKCQLLCKICHIKKTTKERGHDTKFERKEHYQRYRSMNKDKIRLQKLNWYERTHEVRLEKQKLYRLANKDSIRLCKQKCYQRKKFDS